MLSSIFIGYLDTKMPRIKKVSKSQRAAYDSWIAIRKKQIDELATQMKNNKRLITELRKQINRNRKSIASLDIWTTRNKKRVANLQDKIVKIRKRMK